MSVGTINAKVVDDINIVNSKVLASDIAMINGIEVLMTQDIATPYLVSLNNNPGTLTVNLHWTLPDEEGIQEWKVYRATDGGTFVFAATVSHTVGESDADWDDTNTNPQHEYSYYVKAIGKTGWNDSANSNTQSIEVGYLLVPTGLSSFYNATTERFEFSWSDHLVDEQFVHEKWHLSWRVPETSTHGTGDRSTPDASLGKGVIFDVGDTMQWQVKSIPTSASGWGESEYTIMRNDIISESALSAPSGVVVSDSGGLSLVVTWDIPPTNEQQYTDEWLIEWISRGSWTSDTLDFVDGSTTPTFEIFENPAQNNTIKITAIGQGGYADSPVTTTEWVA